MDSSSLQYMTCTELRDAFGQCQHDINKRILIIDVRSPSLFERSHLCLDSRHNISSIKTKMRVMNIDPDRLKFNTAKMIMSILSEHDLDVFRKRRDATEVVLIDSHTEDRTMLASPTSKVNRIIKALTTFDTNEDEKIVVPIQILEGGFREWILKYPHFTTDSSFNPYEDTNGYCGDYSPSSTTTRSPPSLATIPELIKRIDEIKPMPKISVKPSPPMPTAPTMPVKPSLPTPTIKPKTPTTTTKHLPSLVKNAPGTAVLVTPLRTPLPRSHSSPNVAQAEENDLESKLESMNVTIANNRNIYGSENRPSAPPLDTIPSSLPGAANFIRNHQQPFSPPVQAYQKPRFDRNLKPSLNEKYITELRAQLNFGRSPESSGRPITGLQNLGNTCFMNSVIQCLAYIPQLSSYLCSDTYYGHLNFRSEEGTKGQLAIEFGALVEKLNDRRYRYIEPKSFRESVTRDIGFAGNEQQDSHEFLMMLFEKLHHDLNTHAKDKRNESESNDGDSCNISIPRATLAYKFWKKHLELNQSIISDLFEGIFMSTLTCSFCKGQSNTFEVFNCLSLPIPSESRCHITDCLAHFSNPERIDAAWECPRCKQKREADKKIVICKLPKILIIHLKRFSLDGRWRQKLQTTVDFPLTGLNVDYTQVLPPKAYPVVSKSSYNLFAVVNHYGHLDGGHYTSFCKLENQKWYTFDDSNVSDLKDADVCGQAGYILFYSSV